MAVSLSHASSLRHANDGEQPLSKLTAAEYAHAFFFVRKGAPACHLASQRQPHGAPQTDFPSTLIALLALAVLVAAVLNPLPRDKREERES